MTDSLLQSQRGYIHQHFLVWSYSSVSLLCLEFDAYLPLFVFKVLECQV